MIHSSLRKFLTDVVTTWNAGQKMALFMVLMAIEITNYVIWMIYIKSSNYAQQFVNIDIINHIFIWAVTAVFIILSLSYLFYRYQTQQKFILILQLVVMIIYSLAAAYIGYLVGEDNIMSAIAISTAGLLIVMFCDRKLAVWIVLLNLSFMFVVMYASKTGIFPPSNFYVGTQDSAFWVFSYIHLCATKVLVILLLADNILYVLQKSYEKSKFLSEHDTLTKLPNRTTIQSYLLECIEKQNNVGLVMIDLDYFKQTNDNFGHLFGDQVLIEAAKLLSRHLRVDDMLGRYGGEEFILILPNSNLKQSTNIAKQLHHAFNTFSIPIDDKRTLKPTASFGVAATDYLQNENKRTHQRYSSTDMLKQLIKLSDEAMYMAKHNGRNQVISAKDLTSTPSKQTQLVSVKPQTDLRIIEHPENS